MSWPTPYLHGNGRPCSDCAAQRGMQDASDIARTPVHCSTCGGSGVIPLAPAEIVTATVRDRDATEWRRIELAQRLAAAIRKRCAVGENPFRLREVVRGRGLAGRVSRGALVFSGYQIRTSWSLAGDTPDWNEMKAALLDWAEAAEKAKPRIAADGE